jgi:hypothetical protein
MSWDQRPGCVWALILAAIILGAILGLATANWGLFPN